MTRGPYRAYDRMTNEHLGDYDNPFVAEMAWPERGVEVIYRPSKKKAKAKEFPYNGK